jgi:hypothetical protein
MCAFGRKTRIDTDFLPRTNTEKPATEDKEKKVYQAIRQSGNQEVDIRGTGEQGV